MLGQVLPSEFSAYVPDVLEAHAEIVTRAILCLPLAAGIGAALAFRPRRSGTPPRSAPVIQTQIVLAVIGALVMMIVGSSMARAFGIVGAASLIRYRATIEDPKDAVVMLASLSLGLATGVELYGLALFSAVLILALLWIVESVEPEALKTFELTVGTADPVALRTAVERVLRRHGVQYELRGSTAEELVYQTHLPVGIRTDRLSHTILRLTGDKEQAVRWEEAKKKNSSTLLSLTIAWLN